MDSYERHPGPEPAFSGLFSRTFLVVLLLSLGLGLAFKVLFLDRSFFVPDAEPRTVTPRGDLAADERSTIALFESASPSVVHIETTRLASGPRRRVVEVEDGSGSGFVWDRDGHIVTNYHVIRGADRALVTLEDGESEYADLIGVAPDFDLAVLRIDASPGHLPPLPVGSSHDLKVGQKVFAIGNPFGLELTLTTGIISGLDRSILSMRGEPIHGVIQTDAAINPGNSGGPLLDSAGRLIGVNTAIKSPSGVNAGVGFAVPVDTVNVIVPQLLRDGSAARVGLGIQLGPDAWARDSGLEGVVVQAVVAGSGAERAGIEGADLRGDSVRLGDVIVGIDDRPVRQREDLFAALVGYEEGDVVRVRLVRGGDPNRVESVEVRLQELFGLR